MLIEFTKMSGAGNDFIVIDNRTGRFSGLDAPMISTFCRRRTGIGGDGLILMEEDRGTDFFMRYYNSDGYEAELCANGARCAVLFAHHLFPDRTEFTFRSLSGTHRGKLLEKAGALLAEIEMPPPQEIVTDGLLEIEQGTFRYGFVVVGVPHVVLRREGDMEKIDVEGIGRSIRYHRRFQPRGTNVDFLTVTAEGRIEIRTYERGVEEETLACGTGATAAALIATLWGSTRPPVDCLTRGGETLRVDFEFEPRNRRIWGITLTGPAQVVYVGRATLPS
jgi:diaminopimelate epimerase